MSDQPHMAPAQAVALNVGARPMSGRRIGFFPRGPGPGPIVIAIVIGVLPSVFALVVFLRAGVDGGFYQPEDFIRGQHRWFITIATVLTLGAISGLGFIVQALRRAAADKKAPLWVMVAVLLGTIAVDWSFFNFLRANLMPIPSYFDIQAFAEQDIGAKDDGLQSYAYDGQILRVNYALAVPPLHGALLPERIGPGLCVEQGRFFAGPVEEVLAIFTGPDGEVSRVRVPQETCRAWYLRNRTIGNRPRVR
ncbi:hypothetical protein KUL25_04795 [Rhodobacteraceae bacterium N5(2021)]|uniref:Uncharacterized protein n=1 Tax=Gymnodinialimonas phycosphaerae TaxID=2841589 RepID=A0A975YGV3_9RHOB|nr:hypothetical protein [Gymnodinialimonas phycosphaerae]MBY4892077.1 hypothetical protein [Gymnodinialimonas phycosphaerae]